MSSIEVSQGEDRTELNEAERIQQALEDPIVQRIVSSLVNDSLTRRTPLTQEELEELGLGEMDGEELRLALRPRRYIRDVEGAGRYGTTADTPNVRFHLSPPIPTQKPIPELVAHLKNPPTPTD